jgi:hypothetical protein
MIQNFCRQTTRGFRRLGYAEKIADRFAGYLTILEMVVCGALGALSNPSQEMYDPANGSGKFSPDARAAIIADYFYHQN